MYGGELIERLSQVFDADLCHVCRLFRKMAHNAKSERAGEDGHERIAVKVNRPGLHQHHDAGPNQGHGTCLPGTATKPARQSAPCNYRTAHLRTAPKVMPRSRCLRNNTVNRTIGTTNNVVAAATAGQSCPPSPMMKGMKGGMVCASPLVRRTANAYSFHEKIKQKIAVAAIPVTACGSTTLRSACSRV